MNWIAFDDALIQADFPSDLAPLYATWLTENPGKAGRLSEIRQHIIAEIRDNIRSNPANTLDEDETKIPESCLRHAETLVYYVLMMEMGLSMTPEASQSMIRADIFLRQIGYRHFITTGGDQAAPSPHYTPAIEEGEERTLPCY